MLQLATLLVLAATAADLPRYWAVHIDQPADRVAFERIDKVDAEARREFYGSHGIAPPQTWKLVAADGSYLTLRPRGETFTDFDKSPLTPEQSKELQSKTNPLSEQIHKTIRAHHSEIWSVEKDLTTFGGAARKYVSMRVDVVAPPNDPAYEEAMKKLVAQLAAQGVETLAFFSSYGDGAYHYLFTSDQPLKIERLRGLADTRDLAVVRVEMR